MDISRILALFGGLVAVVGLLLKSLVNAGAEGLSDLALPSIPVPIEIPTIWEGLETSVQIVVGILLVVVVVMALWPPLRLPQNTASAIATTVAGVAFLIFTVIKLFDAQDDASALQAIFDQAAAAGVP